MLSSLAVAQSPQQHCQKDITQLSRDKLCTWRILRYSFWIMSPVSLTRRTCKQPFNGLQSKRRQQRTILRGKYTLLRSFCVCVCGEQCSGQSSRIGHTHKESTRPKRNRTRNISQNLFHAVFLARGGTVTTLLSQSGWHGSVRDGHNGTDF
jgi:hypothetical protein